MKPSLSSQSSGGGGAGVGGAIHKPITTEHRDKAKNVAHFQSTESTNSLPEESENDQGK